MAKAKPISGSPIIVLMRRMAVISKLRVEGFGALGSVAVEKDVIADKRNRKSCRGA